MLRFQKPKNIGSLTQNLLVLIKIGVYLLILSRYAQTLCLFFKCSTNMEQILYYAKVTQRGLSDSVCHRVGFWTAHFCKKKYVEKWVEMRSQCQHRVFERILFCPFITFSTPSIYCFFEILPQYSPTFRYALTISRKPFAVHFFLEISRPALGKGWG